MYVQGKYPPTKSYHQVYDLEQHCDPNYYQKELGEVLAFYGEASSLVTTTSWSYGN